MQIGSTSTHHKLVGVKLHKMMNEAGDETVKKAIQEAITKMSK